MSLNSGWPHRQLFCSSAPWCCEPPLLPTPWTPQGRSPLPSDLTKVHSVFLPATASSSFRFPVPLGGLRKKWFLELSSRGLRQCRHCRFCGGISVPRSFPWGQCLELPQTDRFRDLPRNPTARFPMFGFRTLLRLPHMKWKDFRD